MENPLVSLVVVSYNSEKFILETLDSIRDQTYPRLELIVTDDCSTDSTCDLARDWIAANKDRFVLAAVVTSKKNTGVAINANRGLNVATGEWIKLLAADDTLASTAIEDLINFASSEPEAMVIHGNRRVYKNDFQKTNLVDQSSKSSHIFNHPRITPEQQLQILLRENPVSAPTLIFKTQTLRDIGGFVESVPVIEDAPILLKLSANGIKVKYLDKLIANYRVHDNSIMHSRRKLPAADYQIQTLKHKLKVYGKKMPIQRWVAQSLQFHSFRICNAVTAFFVKVNPGLLGRLAHKSSSLVIGCFVKYNLRSARRLCKKIESKIQSAN